jgi:hypothetical protein
VSGEPEHAHASFEPHGADGAEIDRVWQTYWRELLVLPDGSLNKAALRAELYDAWWLVNEARRVYRHVTGGLCDDLTASADGIIACADRREAERVELLKERLRDREAMLRQAQPLIQSAKKLIDEQQREIEALRADHPPTND